MEKQTCILIDDEPHAIGALSDIIGKIPDIDIVGRYNDAVNALASLKQTGEVDFVFLDIEMPGLTGIEAAKLFRPYCRYLLFTTAHSRYALDAFGVDADGFLLKPLSLAAVFEKVEKIQQRVGNAGSIANYSLFLKTGNRQGYVRVACQDIVCVDAGDHYPTIVTASGKIHVYLSMNEIEGYLRGRGNFLRIHRSCIISVDKVSHVVGNIVYLNAKATIAREIGQSYRNDFYDLLHKHTLISSKNKR